MTVVVFAEVWVDNLEKLLLEGTAQSLHDYRPDDLGIQALVELVPRTEALVFGAAQRSEAELLRRAEVYPHEIALRDSGGGVVAVGPTEQIWFGLYLRAKEGFLADDYSKQLVSLGEAVGVALTEHGMEGVSVTRSSYLPDVAKSLCFAGQSYGEILVFGKKLVGLSLRRSKTWSVFHVMIPIADLQSEALKYLRSLGIVLPESKTWIALDELTTQAMAVGYAQTLKRTLASKISAQFSL